MGCIQSAPQTNVVECIAELEVVDRIAPRNFHNDYTLEEKLGAGAYGVVYAASPASGDGPAAAVKVVDLRRTASKEGSSPFNEGAFGLDPRRNASFRDEVRKMKAVAGHINVCRLIESYTHLGLAYIVLERCDRTLLQALERAPALTEDTIRPFFFNMLEGLAFVHHRGIIHRDVKPANFLCCGPTDTVKLCDFGLSCAVPHPSLKTCMSVVGTPVHMAPEMLKNSMYGTKVDTWAFGVIAYVLCYGYFPYMSEEPSSNALKATIVTGKPAPCFPQLPTGVSTPMVQWLQVLLSRQPSLRPTCAEASRHRCVRVPTMSEADLRPALASAKKWGAFGFEASHPDRFVVIERRLRELQGTKRQYAREPKSPAASFDASTEVGSAFFASEQTACGTAAK